MKAFGEFLKPEQITRLKQISYHQRGARRLHRPRGRQEAEPHRRPEERDPVDRPGIHEHRWARSSPAVPGRPRRRHEEDGRAAQGTLEKAVAKLNDEQQKTWKELIGAPFEVKFQPRPQQ